jgi:hypothetical protein
MIINETFKNLIPVLSADEYAQLEQNILQDGIREPLVVWGETLIDGHNRYQIAEKHNVPYRTIQKQFDTESDAHEWIIRNQFGRRNISAYDRARLALKLKPIIAARAKENLKIYGGNQYAPCQKSDNIQQIDTKRELAKSAGVSHDTICKVEAIELKATDDIKDKLKSGDISINQAYQAVSNKPHVSNNSGNNEWYTPYEYIEAARSAMGGIDLDPASCELANKIVMADKIYTVEDDGLSQEWRGNIWLNPPYAGDLIGKFIDKLAQSEINQAVILVNNATETQWFNTLIKKASAIVFPQSRVKFYMPNGYTGAPLQGQAVIYIGNDSKKFMAAFKHFGWGAFLK